MNHLIIIGARGAGREAFNCAPNCNGYGTEFDVKGFLDDKADALDGMPGYPPILSSVEAYTPLADDVFICALGDPHWRQVYADKIMKKGGRFISLIEKSASIGHNSVVGEGCIIHQMVSITTDVRVGNFAYIQGFSVVGHDAAIGNYCLLNSFSFMGGYSVLGDFAVLQTHATLLPHKRVGANAIVGAGSVAVRDVKAGTTVVGVPAVRLKY